MAAIGIFENNQKEGGFMFKSRFISLLIVILLVFTMSTSTALATGSYRTLLRGTFGMVSSNHFMSTKVGVDILEAGGNAVDAAVATAAAIGTVEMTMSGAGGDGFAFYYEAETGELHYLNYSARTPKNLTLEHFKVGEDEYEIPPRGPMVTLIPGGLMGWHELADRFGTMSFAELMEPSIKLAEEGFPVTNSLQRAFEAQLGRAMDWGEYGLDAWYGGIPEAPKVGEFARNPNLAETYRRVVEEGLEVFYGGEIGQHIVEVMQEIGGVWTIEDLEEFYVEWDTPAPLEFTYRDYDLFTVPYNSSGGVATAQILQMLEGYDIKSLGVNSPGYLHLMLEAIKIAAADRAEWACDPDTLDVPFDHLISKEYAAERRQLINPYIAASDWYDAGIKRGELGENTTALCVVDKDGNMVTMVMTLGSGWGSGVTAGETGITLNNAVRWLETDPDSPAVVQGGVRTRWNMHMVLGIHQETGERFVVSTPGGTGIWQTIPQVITKYIDFEMDMQSAIESPRARWMLDGTRTLAEYNMPEDTVRILIEQYGHEDMYFGTPLPGGIGTVAAVTYDPGTGIMTGASDPRRESAVWGY